MYVTMCPDLRCRVYQMNGAEFDPRDVGAEEHSWRVLAFHWGQLPHSEADATFCARQRRHAVHEAWLCL